MGNKVGEESVAQDLFYWSEMSRGSVTDWKLNTTHRETSSFEFSMFTYTR